MTPTLAVLAFLVIVAVYVRTRLSAVVLYEYERGLLYVYGRYVSLLEPGQHWMWTGARLVTRVDMRPRIAGVPGTGSADRRRDRG